LRGKRETLLVLLSETYQGVTRLHDFKFNVQLPPCLSHEVDGPGA